jgi:hypothetical protein
VGRADDTHAPSLAQSVDLLLHALGARLILQDLHLLLELEFSDVLLAAHWVMLPCDVVQFQLMLHTMELLLKLELVQLLLCLLQLLHAGRCRETGAHGGLVPKLVKLPLRLIEFQGAMEIIQLCALIERVDVFLLGRVRPRLSERVGRRPAGGMGQKQSGQQKTYCHGPEQCHQRTSFFL